MTRRSMHIAAAALVVALAPAARLGAHHSSAAAYDATKKVEVQGTVTRVLLKNPHSFVFLEGPDETGQKVEWQVEMGARSGLFIQGWTMETLTPGMVIKVSGIPSRAPGSHGITAARLTKADGTPIGRPGAPPAP